MRGKMQQDKETHAILSHEEILPLLRRAKAGDEEAKERIFLCNVALVRSIVKRYLGHGYDYDDLYQLGCIGLVKATTTTMRPMGCVFPPMRCPSLWGRFAGFSGMME